MQEAVVDSNVAIGDRIPEDQHSEAGRELVLGFDSRELPRVVVLTPILKEILDLISRKVSQKYARKTLDALQKSRGFRIEHVSESDISDAKRLFRRYDGLSLADATIVAYLQRVGLEYLYSFDDDFDVIDTISRLNTPVNPFE